MKLKTIGFDLFGTLLQAQSDHATCLHTLHKKLSEYGINLPINPFLKTYEKIHSDYRTIRKETNVEISNRVVLCEALKQFGHILDINSKPIIEAIKAYFSPWTVTVTAEAEETLQNLRILFTTGVITNFTDTSFIHKCLKDLNLFNKFDHIIVSAEVGWRKPNRKVFDRFLQLTKSRAAETLFVGDDLHSDIGGANALGFTTVLVLDDNHINTAFNIHPDYTISSMRELEEVITILER